MPKDTDLQTHYRTCNLCDSLCGLEIKHRDGEIVSIKGNKEDVFSQGNTCPKAASLQDIHEDQDRLRTPMKRTGNKWQAISWEQAYREISDNIQTVQKDYGQDAVSFFYGTPMSHDYSAQLMMGLLKSVLASKNYFSSVSLDSLPLMFNNLQLFGNQALMPIPDLSNTDFFVCMGGNPLVSNGSVMASGDIAGKIKDIKKRGEFVVIDPRLTESAKNASQHIFIKPGQDVFFLLALIHCVFHDHNEILNELPSYICNQKALADAVKAFSPESVAERTGVAAENIRDLCARFCKAERAILYSRMGICASEFSSLNNLLVTVFNIVTGNFDKKGGLLFTKPVIDLPGLAQLSGNTGTYNTFHSRVSGLPEFEGELPAVAFSEEVLTPGLGKIRALITWGTNIALSVPNGKETEKALKNLDYMVSVDYYINETTRYADIILPPLSPLEKDHFNLALSVITTRNIAKYSYPLYETGKEAKSDGEILLKLATSIGAKDTQSKRSMALIEKLIQRLGFDGIINLLISIGPYGRFKLQSGNNVWKELGKLALKTPLSLLSKEKGLTLRKVASHHNGLDLGELKPCMPQRLSTPDKTINLLPDIYKSQLTKAQEQLNQLDSSSPNELIMIGRRDLRSHNSWLHNSKRLTKGKNRCTAIIHTQDADRLNLNKDSMISVETDNGSITLPVDISESIMPGVISIPHGWGHNRKNQKLSIAESVAGESVNDITCNKRFDSITGMSTLYGMKVRVSTAQPEL